MSVHAYVTDNYFTALQMFIGGAGIIWFLFQVWQSYKTGFDLRPLAIGMGGMLAAVGVGLYIMPVFNPPKTCALVVDSPLATCSDVDYEGRLVILEGDYRYQPGVVNQARINVSAADYATQAWTKKVDQ